MLATEIVGFTAAFCTTFAFLPQAIKVIRTRDTASLSLLMYIVFNIGLVLWLCYGFMRNDTVIMLANIVTLTLSLTILFVKIQNRLRSTEGSNE